MEVIVVERRVVVAIHGGESIAPESCNVYVESASSHGLGSAFPRPLEAAQEIVDCTAGLLTLFRLGSRRAQKCVQGEFFGAQPGACAFQVLGRRRAALIVNVSLVSRVRS